MDKAEFDNKTFDELVDWACENIDDFVSYESLKDFAIYLIKKDTLYLAIHILEALENNTADWYCYDSNMGTLETPTPINLKEDFLDYIEFED